MDPRGPAADDFRRTAGAARDAVARLREGFAAIDATRRSERDRLASQADRILGELSSEIAAELAQDQAIALSEAQSAREAQLEAALTVFEAERSAWLQERSDWEAVRTQVEAELASIENRLVAEAQSLREVRHEAPNGGEVLEELGEAIAAQEAAEAELAKALTQVTQLNAALEEAAAALAAAAEVESELATLREKFDLAVADLQTHRERVAELESALTTAPAAGDNPKRDAELAQLTAERDELAQRLEEVEHSGRHDGDNDSAEWRARFEMAVEDVRELKTENQRLREELATAPKVLVADAEPQGWEAQKRKLLAALESEGSSDEPRRVDERATIEGTVQITDAIVAAKDAELHKLRAALEEAGATAAVDAAAASLIDGDEVVQAQRQRLVVLEEEWQEKIRQAELELSVERAKIARAQSEIAAQQLELETLRAAKGVGSPPGEARRNWLNKLGLGSEGTS